MPISIKEGTDNSQIVALSGELDYHMSAELRTELDKLTARKVSKILIDLKEVTYLDSSVLANFVELSQKVKRYSGKVAFFNLCDKVRYIFELAKFDLFFPIAKTEKEAHDLAR